MVYLHPLRTVGVNSQQFIFGGPLRSSVLNVLSPVVKASWIIRVGSPSFAASGIERILSGCVPSHSLLRNFFSVSRIVGVFFSAPCVLILGVFANVFRLPSFYFSKGARLTSMADRIAFFIVFGARLFNAARGADFGHKGLFRHSDIIARRGDVKQGENGER